MNSLFCQFPLFRQALRHEVELQPGDLLYIPALWFHNMKARDFGVAINIFWKELEGRLYDQKVKLWLLDYFFCLLKRIWEVGVGEIILAGCGRTCTCTTSIYIYPNFPYVDNP